MGTLPEAILFAGGGTGGHVYMAVALVQALRAEQPALRTLFVGAPGGLEERILPSHGIRLETIRVGGLKNTAWRSRLLTLARLPAALARSFRLVRGFSPSLLVGLGGYSSGPVLLAGALLGYPTLLMEPNFHPGFTNRLLLPLCGRVAVAFPETARALGRKAVLTGIPVRREFLEIPPLQWSGGPLRLLVFGGSRGSRALNDLVCECLPHLPPGLFELVHQTGPGDHARVRERYRELGVRAEVVAYIEEMPAYFRHSHLILSRAGALTIAEIVAAGRPSLLVPFPQAAEDHQRLNARALAQRGAALLLPQEETDGAALATCLRELACQPSRLLAMAEASRKLAQPQAGARILALIQEMLREDVRA